MLSLHQYKGLSGTPIVFNALDKVDPVFAKLKSFLPAEKGLTEADTKQLDKIQAWIKKRAAAKANQTPEPTMGELGPSWKPLLSKFINPGLIELEWNVPEDIQLTVYFGPICFIIISQDCVDFAL